MEAQKGKEKSCLKGYLAAKKDLKCFNRGQNQYLTTFGIKSLQKQTAGNNCSVCRTDPLNVRLRAAEIRFGQIKEGKPPMLFMLKKLIQANSPIAEPGTLGLSTIYFTIQSNCSS